jgi:hypothetical protein
MLEAFVAGNLAERQRLFTLTAGLSEDQLSHPMLNGWTVGTKLLHLAFWDRCALAMIEEWKRTGLKPPHLEFEAVNAAALILSRAIPAAAIVPMVREAAETADRAVETMPPEWVQDAPAVNRPHLLDRSFHRRMHLDQIAGFLGPQC